MYGPTHRRTAPRARRSLHARDNPAGAIGGRPPHAREARAPKRGLSGGQGRVRGRRARAARAHVWKCERDHSAPPAAGVTVAKRARHSAGPFTEGTDGDDSSDRGDLDADRSGGARRIGRLRNPGRPPSWLERSTTAGSRAGRHHLQAGRGAPLLAHRLHHVARVRALVVLGRSGGSGRRRIAPGGAHHRD